MNNLEINNNTFEGIKHIDEYGNEYWYGATGLGCIV